MSNVQEELANIAQRAKELLFRLVHTPDQEPAHGELRELLAYNFGEHLDIQHATPQGWVLRSYTVRSLGGLDGTDYVVMRKYNSNYNSPGITIALADIQAVYKHRNIYDKNTPTSNPPIWSRKG